MITKTSDFRELTSGFYKGDLARSSNSNFGLLTTGLYESPFPSIDSTPCSLKKKMLNITTRLAVASTRFGFIHLQRLFGFETQIWFPHDGAYDPVTRTGSIYNVEGQEYRYNESPDLPCEVLVYSNLMDLTRMEATTLEDSIDPNSPFAYTLNQSIADHSRLQVSYANKDFHFFVERVTALESPYSTDDVAIRRLNLRPWI